MTETPHRCHAKGCNVEVPRHLLMCPAHWFKVPKAIRQEVWQHYQKGQEERRDPSREYLEAAKAAIDVVEQKEFGGRLL